MSSAEFLLKIINRRSMEFKVGDRVLLTRYWDACESVDKSYAEIRDTFTLKERRSEKEGVWYVEENEHFWSESQLKLISRGNMEITSLDQLEPGKFYVDNEGDEYEFIGFSKFNTDHIVIVQPLETYEDPECFTKYEVLTHYKWKLKTEPKKMTVSEVCEELGYEVEIVK